jgi:hypothetical protein
MKKITNKDNKIKNKCSGIIITKMVYIFCVNFKLGIGFQFLNYLFKIPDKTFFLPTSIITCFAQKGEAESGALRHHNSQY